MALYDTHRSTATPLSTVIATRIADVLLSVGDLMERNRTRARWKAARLELSDWQLRDLGLERADLDRL